MITIESAFLRNANSLTSNAPLIKWSCSHPVATPRKWSCSHPVATPFYKGSLRVRLSKPLSLQLIF